MPLNCQSNSNAFELARGSAFRTFYQPSQVIKETYPNSIAILLSKHTYSLEVKTSCSTSRVCFRRLQKFRIGSSTVEANNSRLATGTSLVAIPASKTPQGSVIGVDISSDIVKSITNHFSMYQPIQISHLDHLVLTVKNIEASCRFYTEILGMKEITFQENRKALLFGQQKINLHQYQQEFEPKARMPTAGSADLCLIIKGNIEEAIAHLQKHQIPILETPIERTGATGEITSIYIRDPDLNLIELSVYG